MTDEIKDLNRRFEALLALTISTKELKLNEKIQFLGRFDFDNKSISRILGISENHVAKEKSLLKKKNEN